MKTRSKDLEIIEDLLNLLTNTQQTFEVPVAAAIYDPELNLISQSLNQREVANDPTAHAEICVLREAGISQNNWNLAGFSLYITLEPCLMCAGAILQSRVSRVIFGAFNPGDSSTSAISLLRASNPQLEIVGGVLDKECSQFLSQWFSNQRMKKDRI
jgi:tRNA(adenine34) deaminase